MNHLKQNDTEDPWTKHDPWQKYQGPSNLHGGNAQSKPHQVISDVQLAQVEAKLESRFEAKFKAAMTSRDEDADMEEANPVVAQRFAALEEQVQLINARQSQQDSKLNNLESGMCGIQQQMELQNKQFASTVQAQMALQMEKIETLLNKRTRTE